MNVTTSSNGNGHALARPMKKTSQGWKKMKRRHETCYLVKRQVAWFGPAHEEKVSQVEHNGDAA